MDMDETKTTTRLRRDLPTGGGPDLTGFTVVHRAMLGDLRRLADTSTDLLERPELLTPQRAKALSRYVAQLTEEIHHHHTREDDVLWPVIVGAAGAAVDLAPLSDDHRLLDPLLDWMRHAAELLVSDPAKGGPALAAVAGELSDMLHEHITEEEREVFSIIRRYVSVGAWHTVERQMAKGVPLSHAPWLVSWVARWATEAELRRMLAFSPPTFRVLLRLSRGRYAKLERLAFG